MSGIIRGAITDDNGHIDVSYLALFWVMLAVLGAVVFICVMSGVAYFRCVPTPPALACTFDPQPLGIAIAAICGAFSTAIGALAAYMLATKPAAPPPPPAMVKT